MSDLDTYIRPVLVFYFMATDTRCKKIYMLSKAIQAQMHTIQKLVESEIIFFSLKLKKIHINILSLLNKYFQISVRAFLKYE